MHTLFLVMRYPCRSRCKILIKNLSKGKSMVTLLLMTLQLLPKWKRSALSLWTNANESTKENPLTMRSLGYSRRRFRNIKTKLGIKRPLDSKINLPKLRTSRAAYKMCAYSRNWPPPLLLRNRDIGGIAGRLRYIRVGPNKKIVHNNP